MARCRSCGAPIRWAVTTHGRMMPLDAEPNPDGNVTFTGRRRPSRAGDAPEVHVHAVGQRGLDVEDAPDRYMPHHATCPQADDWRNP